MQADQLLSCTSEPGRGYGEVGPEGLTLWKWLEAQGTGSEGRRAPPVLCPACVTVALMQSDSASH